MSNLNFITFCVLANIAFTSAIGLVSYGEECNNKVQCDSKKFLTCSNSSCTCLMVDSMIFENSTAKCVSLAGERCQYISQEDDKILTDEVPCISNAACQNGVCECNPNYYKISNGTCQEKHKYGDPCISNEMCSSSKYQVCGDEKTCSCDPFHIYDKQFEMCVAMAGTKCEGWDTCVANAFCNYDFSNPLSFCACQIGYFKTENGTCEENRDLGEFCTEHQPCKNVSIEEGILVSHFLLCNNGNCTCDHVVSMEYSNNGNQKCGKLLGLPCIKGECFTGAECNNTCQCETSSYFETEFKTCEHKRGYRFPCSDNKQCLNNLTCDPYSHTCDCPTGKGYHADLGVCAVSPEYSCRTYGKNVQCVPNANCDRGWSGIKCTCNSESSYGIKLKKYCFIKENGGCYGDERSMLVETTTKDCLPGLVCRNSTCSCKHKDHQRYNSDDERCYSLIDGPCDVANDCDDKNAECIQDNGVKLCRCKLGFTQAGRECDIAYMGRCSLKPNTLRCDRFGPLECNNFGYCSCSDFQVYDFTERKCKGLVGSKCNVKEEKEVIQPASQFCVDGATCRGFRGFENIVGICVCKSGMVSQSDRTCKKVETLISTTETLDSTNSGSLDSELSSFMADGLNNL